MEELTEERRKVTERLRQVLKEENESGRVFSKSIGLSPTSFHKVLTGTAALTPSLANSIELVYGYRAQWLLRGEGMRKADPREKLNAAEQTILAAFRDPRVGIESRINAMEEVIVSRLRGDVSMGLLRFVFCVDHLVENETQTQQMRRQYAKASKLDDDFKDRLRHHGKRMPGERWGYAALLLDLYRHAGGRDGDRPSRCMELSPDVLGMVDEAVAELSAILDDIRELTRLSPELEERRGGRLAMGGPGLSSTFNIKVSMNDNHEEAT